MLQTPKDANHNIARADHLYNQALGENKFRVLAAPAVAVPEKKRGRKRKLLEKLDSAVSEMSNGTSVDAGASAGAGAGAGDPTNVTNEATTADVQNMDTTEANVDESIENNQTSMNDVAMGLEDDYQMLEYLQIKGSGQVPRAQFLALVGLCRGRGMLLNIIYYYSKNQRHMKRNSLCVSCSCQNTETNS